MAILHITQAEAKEMMDSGRGAVMLDVREDEEYCTGHAAGALNLPVDSIDAESAAAVIPTLDTPVLVYCRSGRRAAMAAGQLGMLGYTRIYDVGSLIGWPYEMEY